jgi:hypothetical protein
LWSSPQFWPRRAVEGQRQVLIAHHMPGVSAADLAEQQAILESIDVVP